jgi:hypothetical protein
MFFIIRGSGINQECFVTPELQFGQKELWRIIIRLLICKCSFFLFLFDLNEIELILIQCFFFYSKQMIFIHSNYWSTSMQYKFKIAKNKEINLRTNSQYPC